MFKAWIFSIVLFSSYFVHARLITPKLMVSSEQDRYVRILGLGMIPALAYYKVPLGGFEGAEVSIDYQSVETKDLSELGARSKVQDFTSLTYFTFSKGIYYNIDLSFSFSPGFQQENMQGYAAHARWTSDPMWRVPLTYGSQIFGHGLQVDNEVSVKNLGMDFFVAYYLNDISISGGVGFVRTIANFVGSAGITSSGNSEQIDLYGSRWFGGLSGIAGKITWGVDASQYDSLSFTGRLGYRF